MAGDGGTNITPAFFIRSGYWLTTCLTLFSRVSTTMSDYLLCIHLVKATCGDQIWNPAAPSFNSRIHPLVADNFSYNVPWPSVASHI